MRLAFMGSPEFAVPALNAVHAAGHEIVAVYCQPPRPAGRGHATHPCAVHARALELGLDVRHPVSLKRDPQAQADFAALNLDVAVVVAYGLILPQAMLDAPKRGCLNIHASLLPRWRGAAPINAAIMAGDTISGVTIMRMDAGLDTGPMLLHDTTPITPQTTAQDLHDALSAMGARLILRALDQDPPAQPQPQEGVCIAPKLSRADSPIDWSRDARAIDCQIRALTPWPGTTTQLNGETLKILMASPAPAPEGHPLPSAGTVLDGDLSIACGQGILRLLRVQRAGRGALETKEFLRGTPVPVGTILQ